MGRSIIECSECPNESVGRTEREAVIESLYHFLDEHEPTEEQERVLRDRIKELENGGSLTANPHPVFTQNSGDGE